MSEIEYSVITSDIIKSFDCKSIENYGCQELSGLPYNILILKASKHVSDRTIKSFGRNGHLVPSSTQIAKTNLIY